jgi:hypothetical protein
MEKVLGFSAEIIKRPRRWVRVPEGQEPPPYPKGFIVLPRRWVVERSFSWTGQNRRMSKDHERVPETGEALLYVAMSRLMVRSWLAYEAFQTVSKAAGAGCGLSAVYRSRHSMGGELGSHQNCGRTGK